MARISLVCVSPAAWRAWMAASKVANVSAVRSGRSASAVAGRELGHDQPEGGFGSIEEPLRIEMPVLPGACAPGSGRIRRPASGTGRPARRCRFGFRPSMTGPGRATDGTGGAALLVRLVPIPPAEDAAQTQHQEGRDHAEAAPDRSENRPHPCETTPKPLEIGSRRRGDNIDRRRRDCRVDLAGLGRAA